MPATGERAIVAWDFAGIVPASRGAHCRPLHPWLASLCYRRMELGTDPRHGRAPGVGRSHRDRREWLPLSGVTDRRTESAGLCAGFLSPWTTIDIWRELRGGVAVI